jgi:mono/diheme cytochrome c family protein
MKIWLPLAFLAAGVGLMAQNAPVPHPATKNPHLGNPQSIRSGMALYRERCSDCHGMDAAGYRGPDLTALMNSGTTDERLFQTIRKGVPGTEMPKTDDPDDDILMVIAYLRNLGAVAAPEASVGNVENGGRLFAAQCATCHRVAGRGGRLGPDGAGPSDRMEGGG